MPLNEQVAADMIMADFAYEIWTVLPERYAEDGLETPCTFSQEDCGFALSVTMSKRPTTSWRQRFERYFCSRSRTWNSWTGLKYRATLKQLEESDRYETEMLHELMWEIFQRWYAIPSQNRRRVWQSQDGAVSMQRRDSKR